MNKKKKYSIKMQTASLAGSKAVPGSSLAMPEPWLLPGSRKWYYNDK
jgi:hypothetical protein